MTPRTRGECVAGPRPCPHTSCRYQLGEGPEPSTCVLDVADKGGATLEQIGDLLGLTRERCRQIEAATLKKLHTAMRRRGFEVEPAPTSAGAVRAAQRRGHVALALVPPW